MPLVIALAVGKRRVENRDLVAKARREPADGLGREGNLWDHHDRAATRLELLRNCLEIHLGLARPCYAKEKDWLRRGRYDTERRRLLVVQRERFRRKDAPHVAKRIAALLPRSDADEAEPPKFLERRRCRLKLAAQLLHPAAAEADDLVIDPLAASRHWNRRRREGRRDEVEFLRPCVGLHDCGGNGGLQDRLDGRSGVGGESAHKLQ